MYGRGRIVLKRGTGMTRSGRKPSVIMMTRLPVPGRTKTRLAADVGDIEAARAQSVMGRLICERLRALTATGEACFEVQFTGGSRAHARQWLGKGVLLRKQAPGDLGDRLLVALQGTLARGASGAVVVGSDCPAITPEHLREALMLLASSADIVIGPAEDGGYWLLGVSARFSHELPVLFEEIDWGSSRVFQQTVGAAQGAGASVAFLPVLRDVDRPQDLPLLEEALAEAQRARDPVSLSVVIPSLNEAEVIADAVTAALRCGAQEVIVADGGSEDSTREIAAQAGARVMIAPAGRANQMNAGAREARCGALLFVHADCLLPPSAGAAALRCLRDGAVAGAFTFGTDSSRWRDQWAASAGRLRHRVTGHAYGDQGLFLSARTFHDLGGFPSMPVMEDWEMARRLRRLGELRILPIVLPSSSRAWQQYGVTQSFLINAAVIAGYRLGIQPAALATLRRAIAAR